MSFSYIPIQRKFSEVPKTEQEQSSEDFSYFLNRQKTKWEDIIDLYRVVILAEAGAGKTEEMMHTAKKLHSEGKCSFFIRIENIDADFSESFEETGTEEAFDEWLASDKEAWFFLDSVDEAKLESSKAFNQALRKFAKRIKKALSRSHIFISSRPYAWQPKADTELVDNILSFEQVNTEACDEEEVLTKLYILNPLSQDDIHFFVKEREVEDADGLMAEIALLNMPSIASRPFDLELVIQKFKSDGKLGSRSEMLQHTVKQMLNDSHTPNRSLEYLDLQKAQEGARLLATTVTLVNQSGVNVPDDNIDKNGIDPEEILIGWKFSEIRELLNSGIFNDILYGSVRFRHKEIRDYLSAEWFDSLLKQDGNLRAVEDLFFASMYGEEVIRPRLRPVLSWLILFNETLRIRALSISPEIAVEGGDVASLTLSERKTILTKIVHRISLQQDNRSARGNSEIARFAQTDLKDCVLELIKQYRNNDDVIYYLGRLAWLIRTDYCNEELTLIAVDHSRGIYARIAATRAFMTSSSEQQKYEFWEQANESDGPLQRSLLVEIVTDAPATQEGIDLLLNSFSKLEPYKKFQYSGLNSSFSEFVERLTAETNGEDRLMSLIEGISSFISTSPYIQNPKYEISKQFYWLIPLALDIIEHFVKTKSENSFKPEVISILLIKLKLEYWGGGEIDLKEYKGDLNSLISGWTELNDYLLWKVVEFERQGIKNSGEKLDEYRQVLYLSRELFQFSQKDFQRALDFIETKPFIDDQMIALTLAFDIYDNADRPALWFTLLEKSTNKGDSSLSEKLKKLQRLEPICEYWTKHNKKQLESQQEQEKNKLEREASISKCIQDIKDNPSVVLKKSDTYPDDLISAQIWMLNNIKGDNNGSISLSAQNFQHLVNLYGLEPADNFKSFAKAHWRAYQPELASLGGAYNIWSCSRKLGALGLEFEYIDNPDFVSILSNEEISKALHYITSELNGLPSWFESLFNSHQHKVLEFIQREVVWELKSTPSDQIKYYLLSTLSNQAKWLHSALALYLLNWLDCRNEPRNYKNLKECLNIIFSGISSKEKIANLAIRKVSNPNVVFDSFWHVVLISANSFVGYHKLKTKLESLDKEKAIEFAQDFSVKLVGSSFDDGFKEFYTFTPPELLANLYLLMHEYIKVEDDERHASGESYMPSRRDGAQSARSRLFNLLVEIPGKETYFEVLNLINKLPVKNSKFWLISSATSRAEKDSELDLWTTKQMAEFAINSLKTPRNNRELFQLGLRHLLELKDWLETGNDSLAETYQKAKNETEVRKITAYHLRQKSLGKYTCNEEQPLANEQRPDIWLEVSGVCSPVPIEIKQLDKNWSGKKLCERLRNQLSGDYLREGTASCGIFLLVWCGHSKPKNWMINRQAVNLSKLKDSLQDYWQSISPEHPGIESIEVIVIDLTKRKSVSNA